MLRYDGDVEVMTKLNYVACKGLLKEVEENSLKLSTASHSDYCSRFLRTCSQCSGAGRIGRKRSSMELENKRDISALCSCSANERSQSQF